jgi:predicted DNA-binding protein with PD1-like motif
MNEFATGMELVTEKLYEMSGEDLPAHLKAKKEERKALAAVATALKALEEAEKRYDDERRKENTETPTE